MIWSLKLDNMLIINRNWRINKTIPYRFINPTVPLYILALLFIVLSDHLSQNI